MKDFTQIHGNYKIELLVRMKCNTLATLGLVVITRSISLRS
jgi:hypothetical protein